MWDDGTFDYIGIKGFFRTSTTDTTEPIPSAFFRALQVTESGIFRNGCVKPYGHPVRCIKDE